MNGTTATPLNVALVGAGVIGANHVAAMLRHPRLRIVAVVDVDPVAGAAMVDRIALETVRTPAFFDSLEAALAAGGIDMVSICTPTGVHAELSVRALQAGVHVVVEKPMDVSVRQVRELVAAADEAHERGVVCSVICQHRFDPASVVIADAIAAGQFGRLTSGAGSVAWWRPQKYYEQAAWRGTWKLDGGGALINQSIHTVDLLCWFLGTPVEVSAYTARLSHEHIEVEDVAALTIRFESGALAVLHATTAAYPGLSVRVQVHGDRGSAIIHDDQLEYFYAAPADEVEVPRAPVNQAASVVEASELRGVAKPADSWVVGHLRQYEDVVRAIDEGRLPGVGVREGLVALAVVEAVYRSAELGRPVAVQEILSGALDEGVQP